MFKKRRWQGRPDPSAEVPKDTLKPVQAEGLGKLSMERGGNLYEGGY